MAPPPSPLFPCRWRCWIICTGSIPGFLSPCNAGELVPGLAPPEALTFHIRDAIEVCGYDGLGRRLISDPCRQFLADSPKARLQWWLKAALAEFESDLARDDRPFIPAAAYPEPALAY